MQPFRDLDKRRHSVNPSAPKIVTAQWDCMTSTENKPAISSFLNANGAAAPSASDVGADPVVDAQTPIDAATYLQERVRANGAGSTDVQRVSFRAANGAVGNRDGHTHQLHRYPAKLFWRIPSIILDSVCRDGGKVVLDPFCGSGTTLVEALIHGCIAIGCDTNPLARRISKAKTTGLPKDAMTNCLEDVCRTAKRMRRNPTQARVPPFWFSSPARGMLFRLSQAIAKDIQDCGLRNFFEVTLCSIVRECSLADPTIPPPVRMKDERAQRAGPRYRRALDRARALNSTAIMDMFERRALRNIGRIESLMHEVPDCQAQIRSDSALATGLPDKSIDVVVTSPPYCGGAQKYTRTLRLELLLLGHTPHEIRTIDRQDIGSERGDFGPLPDLPLLTSNYRLLIAKIKEINYHRWRMLVRYLAHMSLFASELGRLLKPNGSAFVCLGTSHFGGIAVDISACFVEFAEAAGLRLVTRMIDLIPSRGLITKRHATSGVIEHDDVLWFQR